MREIDPKSITPHESYRLMIGAVVPRPIAWVSTVNAAGQGNLAPFSFFGAVTSDPPTLVLSVSPRDGRVKDTTANLLATGEAVIHIPTRTLAERMVATSAEVPPEVDEFALAHLTKAASRKVKPPRIAEAPIAMEAKVVQHQKVGHAPVDMFMLEVVYWHVDEAVLKHDRIDAHALAAIGRLGGLSYCDTAVTFELERPGRS
ncbi:MAG: flavin reductase family protein [Myxococcota bacterium]